MHWSPWDPRILKWEYRTKKTWKNSNSYHLGILDTWFVWFLPKMWPLKNSRHYLTLWLIYHLYLGYIVCNFQSPSIKTVALTVVWSRPISYRESDFWANLAFWPWKKPCRAFRHSCNLIQDPKLHIRTHFKAIGEYLRILIFLVDLRQHDYHPNLKNSQIFTDCYKNVSEYVILDPE